MEERGEVRPAADRRGQADRHGQAERREQATRHVVAGVLLALTFVALLWVPSYARVTPTLGGIPFFYWYSVLWLVVNAICQIIAYRLIARRHVAGVAR